MLYSIRKIGVREGQATIVTLAVQFAAHAPHLVRTEIGQVVGRQPVAQASPVLGMDVPSGRNGRIDMLRYWPFCLFYYNQKQLNYQKRSTAKKSWRMC